MAARHLVVLEAGSKQAYVFATNKRREAVGASQLIHQVGVDWLDEAIEGQPGTTIVVRTSGTATLLVDDRAVAREIVASVTHRALEHATGLDVYGYVSGPVELTDVQTFREAQAEAFRGLAEVRARRPGPALRGLQLPLIAKCRTSNLPAAGIGGPERLARSQESLDKLDAARDGYRRMAEDLKVEIRDIERAADQLEEPDELVAVIHADGNGLGAIFADFDSGASDVATHLECLQAFSTAVERCTKDALRTAVRSVIVRDNRQRSDRTSNAIEDARKKSKDKGRAPVLPLIVGGDDITVVCLGSDGIDLTLAYLQAFEEATAKDGTIRSVAGRMLGHEHLTASAGVALTKPHHPFFAAYELAEQLCGSAKRLLRDHDLVHRSSLDFHVVFDSSNAELDVHRDLPDGKRAVSRPAVVPSSIAGGAPVPSGVCSWEAIEGAAAIVTGSDGPSLPRSVWHAIRSRFAVSGNAADELYRRKKRERGLGDATLFGPSLFRDGPRTLLGDALDLLDASWGDTRANPDAAIHRDAGSEHSHAEGSAQAAKTMAGELA